MKLTQLTPIPGELELAGFEALREHFAKRFWAAPSFLLNLVTTTDGVFAGATGSSRDISNEADYQSLIGYRMAADGILTTAKTARTEQYRRSRHAPLALVSKSGDFSGIPAVEQDTAGPQDSPVILLVKRSQIRASRKRYQAPWVRVVSTGGGGAFRLSLALSGLGWRRILVEVGPSYANWLISRSVIRGLALTVVGFTGGSPLAAATAAFENLGIGGAVLESAEVVDETLFTRWSELVAKPLNQAS